MFDREHIAMDQRGAVIFAQARRDIIVHFSRSRTMPPKKQVEDAPESGAVLTVSGSASAPVPGTAVIFCACYRDAARSGSPLPFPKNRFIKSRSYQHSDPW